MRYTRNEPHRHCDWLDLWPAGSESETPPPCHHQCEASSKRKRSIALLSTRCGQTCSAIYLTGFAYWLVAFFLSREISIWTHQQHLQSRFTNSSKLIGHSKHAYRSTARRPLRRRNFGGASKWNILPRTLHEHAHLVLLVFHREDHMGSCYLPQSVQPSAPLADSR
jgi:hypothetical protein